MGAAVAQEDLQDTDIGAGLHQMGGKAVAQGVHGDLLDSPVSRMTFCKTRLADGGDMTLGLLSREEVPSLRPDGLVVWRSRVKRLSPSMT